MGTVIVFLIKVHYYLDSFAPWDHVNFKIGKIPLWE